MPHYVQYSKLPVCSSGLGSTTTFPYTLYASRAAKLRAEIYCILDSFSGSSNSY